MKNSTTPTHGTYEFQNPFNYVNNTYVVTDADLVEVYTITVAHYPSELLTSISKAAFGVLLAAAKSWGYILFVPAPEPAEVAAPIGRPAARLIHVELGRLGYRTSASHYDLAAAVLGRDVTSLAALTAEEAALTRSYAYGQLGLETGSVAA